MANGRASTNDLAYINSNRPSTSTAHRPIPEHDEGPLFDPSGLGSSYQGDHDDELSNEPIFDPNSYAAFRLGISPPPPLNRGSPSYDVRQTSATTSKCPADPEMRGRRPRHPQAEQNLEKDNLRSPYGSTDSRLNPADNLALAFSTDSPSPSSSSFFSPSQTAGGGQSSQAPRYSLHEESPVPSRSTAAAFLSSFSNRNSMVDRPSTSQRADSADQRRVASEAISSTWNNLADSTRRPSAGVLPPLPPSQSSQKAPEAQRSLEEEGGRFGPGQQYRMGKFVGFGGFSTIREAYDAGPGGVSEGPGRKLAVKLIYHDLSAEKQTDELDLWRKLPRHPNLLPLEYDERIPPSQTTSAEAMDSSVASLQSSFSSLVQDSRAAAPKELELLVMPFCDGGNLLQFIRNEGGRREVGTASSLSRSQSGLERNRSMRRVTDGLGMTSGSITQRGFAPRSASTFSGEIQTSPGTGNPTSASLQRTASTASSNGSSVYRRSSQRVPRSEGVALRQAKEVVQHIARGLLCLHNDCHVLHGDLKLENVLAERITESAGEILQWKLADFGLSKDLSTACPEANLRRYGHGGGSTAYTAPEVWRDRDARGNTNASTFAPDMWALGCIVYALLSGRLPFNDSFEPRLQAKIAKAEWEFPSRLWRRTRRLVGEARASDNRETSRHARSSTSGTNNSESTGQEDSLRRFGRHLSFDLSSSLPSLAAQQGVSTYGDLAAVHEAPVVGSVPTHPDAPDRFDIDPLAQALADAEADPDSDADSTIEVSWDGHSADRAAVRAVLRGLLEPDPLRRWTINDLASCAWLELAEQVTVNPVSEEAASATVGSPSLSSGASSPKRPYRPQWNRSRSWRSNLTFDRVDLDSIEERLKNQQRKRQSSLTRSKPEHGNASPVYSPSAHWAKSNTADETATSIIEHPEESSDAPRSPVEPRRGRQGRNTDARLTPLAGSGSSGTASSSTSRSRSKPIPIRNSREASRSGSRSQSASRIWSYVNEEEKSEGQHTDVTDTSASARPHDSVSSRARFMDQNTLPTGPEDERSGRLQHRQHRPSMPLTAESRTSSSRSSTSRSRSRAREELSNVWMRQQGRHRSSSSLTKQRDGDEGGDREGR